MDKEALQLEKQINELTFVVDIIQGIVSETDGICVSNADFVKIVDDSRQYIVFKCLRGNPAPSNLGYTIYAIPYKGQLITTRTSSNSSNEMVTKHE